ncbi:MAG: hypothetical protein ACLUIQ_07525 [Dialister invisus]
MTLDEIGTRLEAARGRIDRIYCHWTGAPYQLVECLAYHVVIDRGGYCHVIHEDFTGAWRIRGTGTAGRSVRRWRAAVTHAATMTRRAVWIWGVSRRQRRRWSDLRCSARGL